MSAHDDIEENEHLKKAAGVRISMNMTPREAFQLIIRMASDDEFRERLQNNPHEVLAEHHVYVPSRDIPLHASLPPKEELQQVLLDVMSGHQGTIAELPFNVDPQYWFFIDFLIFLLHRSSSKTG